MRCARFSVLGWMRSLSAVFWWRSKWPCERASAGAPHMSEPVIALLGRRDEPTDAVEQYCIHLGEGLRAHDFAMEILRVPWRERGWALALRNLRQRATDWRGRWVLL